MPPVKKQAVVAKKTATPKKLSATQKTPTPQVPDFAIETWPIGRPIPYARNARKLTDEDVSQLAALIQEYGFRVPIIVDTENVIIAGHTRLAAAQKLGLTHVPVHVARGLTKAQAKGLRLADNRVAQNTKWDFELLSLELEELKTELNFDLVLTGFAEHEIGPLLAADWKPDTATEDFDDHTRDPDDDGMKTISVTEEQHELIGSAIFTLRTREKNSKISDGRALELMAGFYLQTGPAGSIQEKAAK